MRRFLYPILGLMLAPLAVRAQTALPACARSNTYFAFQVDRPAVWIPDTTLTVQPTPTVDAARARVSFVVDTTGHPVMSSLLVVLDRDTALAEHARTAIAHWKFHPAQLDGCRAAQLVIAGVQARPG